MPFLEGKRPLTESEIVGKMNERKEQHEGFNDLSLDEKLELTRTWREEVEAEWVDVKPNLYKGEDEKNG